MVEADLKAALLKAQDSPELKEMRLLKDLMLRLLDALKSPGDRAADEVLQNPKPSGQVDVPSNQSDSFETKTK